MAIFVRIVVGALLCLGGISAGSLSEKLRAADVNTESIVEVLSKWVSITVDKKEIIEAFLDKIERNEGPIWMNYFSDMCCKDARCTNYRGKLATTKSGHTCQDWDKDDVHYNQYYDPDTMPGMTDFTKNYCRNPNSREEGAWCYTLNPDVEWEYCDIPLCEPDF